MRKKITILFNGNHLSYSPTVIALYDLLSKEFDVTIVASDPGPFDGQRLTKRNVFYKRRLFGRTQYAIKRVIFRLFKLFDDKIARLINWGFSTDVIFDFESVKKYLKRNPLDILITIDFKNLLFAQLLGKKAEFLSLEIEPDDLAYAHCDFQNIDSITIQTKERYDHLFNGRNFKTFFVQNAPVFTMSAANPVRKGLVYCGTAWDPFGFYHCLRFVTAFPEYTLNVKGALLSEDRAVVELDFRDLLLDERLIIDNDYLDDSEVVDYLRRFRAGFCFYNFDVEWVNSFNYYSAPSGKMFKYFAAGVPVIAQDILGMKPVKEFDCGVLIKDLEPETIKNAVDEIEANFDRFSQNSLKAAEHYSFDKTAKPFIDYLANKNS